MSMTPSFPTREQCVLTDIIAAHAARTPDKVAVSFGDYKWTYRETATEAWRVGNALRTNGVRIGDSVTVWLPTGPDVLRLLLGCTAVGGVYAPLNLASKGRYLEQTLNLAESKVIFAHAQLAERLVGLDLPYLQTVVVAGEYSELRLPYEVVSLADYFAGASDERPVLERPIEPWDDLSLIYTSGTTGPSKAVRAAHAAFWNYSNTWLAPFYTPQDIYLQALPMFHTAGTGITYSMLSIGATLALNDGFSAKTFWSDVARHQATGTLLLHGMVSYLLDQPLSEDDAHNTIRVAFMGPLSRSKEFSKRFGLSLYTGFGMTEVPVPIVSGLNPENERSCGRAADPDNFQLRLVDEHDVEVPTGVAGELIVRHTLPWTINSGYRNMPEATATAWRNGWFHTGDQFMVDESGDYYFLDRLKDSIRRRGENISSFEVEAEIISHPAVREVAVVGVTNPGLDEAISEQEVMAVISIEPNYTIDPLELVAYLADRMPRHWVPRYIHIVDALPRTESHKVKKAELRSAGVGEGTWDREAAGIRYKREILT
jgi:crotonobetaine/carnitine-CoA ligase